MERDSGDALNWLEEGLAALNTVGTPEATYHQGYLHLIKSEVLGKQLGLMDDALTSAETGLSLLPKEPTPAHLTALTNLSVIHALKGDLAMSNHYINQGIPVAEALGDARRLATMYMNRGINAQKDARLNDAVIDLEKAREIFERIGDADQEGSVWVNLGMIYTIWANDEEAIRCLLEAVELAKQHNIPNLEAYAKTTLVRPYLYTDQTHKAENVIDEALTLCRQYRYLDLSAIALMWQAWLQHVHGDMATALQSMSQAIEVAQVNRFIQEAGMAWSLQGQLLDANQQFAAAEEAHRQALTLLEQQDRYELALAQLAFVQHHLHQAISPLPQGVAELLENARAIFGTLEASREIAVCNALLVP